ncbi:hypothetical protein GZH49_02860 [Nocardia terpenica]|uniref:hypothetical protein n=1 Tax=Nocardia terpenica TaxID=455432 RepID=UPI002FE14FE7
MSTDCQPLITPDDCHPTGADAPVTDTPVPHSGPLIQIHPEAPPGVPAPVRHAVDPVVQHIGGWHAPDLSHAAHFAGTSLVCGLVVVAMLVMIVAVATGWPLAAHRLRNFAIAALLLPFTSALAGGSWSTPLSLFWSGACEVTAGDWSGLRMMLALGAPFAALTATYVRAKTVVKADTVGFKHLGRTERFRERAQARTFRAAVRAARLGAPHSAGSSIVLGALADRANTHAAGLWRELTGRHQHWLTVPHREVKKHQGIIATTGAGKTELIKRHAFAVFDYEWRAWQRWKDVPGMNLVHKKPQLAIISCKGGQDDIDFALEVLSIATAYGIPREEIALVIPGGDRLDIWKNMSASDQCAIMGEFLGADNAASTSEGQHFEDCRKRIVSLVCKAPIGAPDSSREFTRRLAAHVLKDSWGNDSEVNRQIAALQNEKVDQLDDALNKCANLFELLADANGNVVFDGGKSIDEVTVLFMTVPPLDKDAGRAQVQATLRLLMQRAGRTAKPLRRSVTAYLDEASALTTKRGSIGLEEIAERGRSQNVSLVFAGQSPESLAGDKWTLDRLLKACAGGLLLGYFENAGELCKHFGSVHVMLPTRHLIKGQRHGDEGQVSVGERWLVDPDRVRQFDTGDFVYAKAGHAWYGRVVQVDHRQLAPLPGTPAALAAARKPATTAGGDAATAAA